MSLANKDASMAAKDAGKTALLKGDYAKAIRMFDKSMRLYPVAGVPEMKKRAETELAAKTHKATAPAPRRESAAAGGGDAAKKRGSTKGYTPEQERMAKQIIAAGKKGHYEVLGVGKDATEDAVKKAYKKLALKLHPDKNSAPEAESAFKAVSMAYSVLSDSEKKRHYDLYGSDDPSSGGGGGMRRQYSDPSDINPEDIFNMFFGGGAAFGNHGQFRAYRQHPMQRRQEGQRQGEAPQNGAFQLLQMAPLILLLLMSFFSYPSVSQDPPFSLNRAGSYTHKRSTSQSRYGARQGIEYWVKENFSRTYGRDRYQLSSVEQAVTQQFHDELKYQCQVQKQQQKRREQRARQMRTRAEREEALQDARDLELESCDEYRNWFGH
uniref:J domain-containing protein n=1 Tax=Octactis speculum TaxID=3111310 RepID=A0A7S2DVK4_9STRA|mmetsp:Transcript_54272/g.74155  ORF Transcript_54272/g.74155 Transcript_54272/m.74155 type:complete len:380 (+) Transcript_54272:31-1170(+)|eukprot:CAMPEP_0185777940 /NCGR_PEP_ID=MMETSP1174-20130828/91256_1 /TAXON_ID=35687 /ORGANISM="Dictyocha speculum, Strain CCMP1381" /LENGTH=379 /DNA_ID=CAMNT_0028466513 /DNA_START=31 /DNA_END=1170 /DNA_ORIENTATION=+